MSLMMLFSGVMMFIAALKGNGNDTVAMPLGITVAGVLFTACSFYKIGRMKADLERIEDRKERSAQKTAFFMQVGETLIYVVVAGLGIFLLINQSFMNKVLNLMAGGFTTLNGVLGIIYIYKNRHERDIRRSLKVILTIVELILGPYFIFMSDSIEIGWYVAMGALTTVAGTIEVISALTPESIKSTVQDGKDIVRILKD